MISHRTRARLMLSCAALTGALCASAHAQSAGHRTPPNSPTPQIVEFDAPGAADSVSTACGSSCGTFAFAINDKGVVTGYYTDKYVVPHGFIRESDGQVRSFDAPGAGLGHGLNEGTVAIAINDRKAVAGQFQDANLVYHGFLRSPDGAFTTIDAPSAGAGAGQGTVAQSLDHDRTTAGVYIDANNAYHGFVRRTDGAFTSFDAPGATFTYVCQETCLNDTGAATGFFTDSGGVYHGFLRAPDGTISVIDPPGVAQTSGFGTFAASIDAHGAIGGYFYDTTLLAHGFIRGADGKFVTFDAPKSNKAGTYPFSINAFRAVTGQTQDNRGFERFANGDTETFVAPHAARQPGNFNTRPSVNNPTGRVAGWYTDSKGLNHGFIWTP